MWIECTKILLHISRSCREKTCQYNFSSNLSERKSRDFCRQKLRYVTSVHFSSNYLTRFVAYRTLVITRSPSRRLLPVLHLDKQATRPKINKTPCMRWKLRRHHPFVGQVFSWNTRSLHLIIQLKFEVWKGIYAWLRPNRGESKTSVGIANLESEILVL